MKAVASRARLAFAVVVVTLFSTIGVSFALYIKTTTDLNAQRNDQIRLQLALLASLVIRDPKPSDNGLEALLKKYAVSGHVFLYTSDGKLAASASTSSSGIISAPPFPSPSSAHPGSTNTSAAGQDVTVRTEGGMAVGETRVGQNYVLILERPTETEPFSALFYILAYQLLAVAGGLAVIAAIVRWLLRPYRRMVEAAHGSPIRASSETSESEFVVETFQALITQLQAKEKELAELHKIERRRAEKSERFSERLISNIPSGMVVISAVGTVTSANTYAAEIFAPQEHHPDVAGIAADNGNLRSLDVEYESFFKGAPRMVSLVSDCLSRGLSFRREEVDIVETDGRVRHLGLSISPITDSAHNIEAALCLITDITEVTELRERMKVQENLANLGEMAAGLAHEFKNSLATIQGYIQLLQAQTPAPANSQDRSPTFDAALNEVRLLSQLVTDFLNFARPQELALGVIDLREIIEGAAYELQPRMAETGIQISIAGEFPALRADEVLLRRAFSNLIRNAVEAIDPGSREKSIEVQGSADAGRNPRYAHVRILDTGSGILTRDLQRIFIPFFTTKSRGYGVGLALVQKIFVAHGGSVAVEKSTSSGTTFHCKLPLIAEPAPMESVSQSVE